MPTNLTPEQILALAPDPGAASAGRGLAQQRHWLRLGQGTVAIWGECQGSGKEPYRVQVDLRAVLTRCSCPSRKFPCKHALGLLLLAAGGSADIPQAEPPPWVSEWLTKRDAAESPAAGATKPAKRASKDKSAASRAAAVAVGLDELERWLHDQVRQGLAATQSRGPAVWDAIAARMIDAQAPGVARMLRETGSHAHTGAGWQGRVLERISRLQLLISGYRRLAELPKPLQAEIRNQIGWNQRQEDLRDGPLLRDHWQVLGQYTEQQEQLRTRRTWLWGSTSGRAALILAFAPPGQPLEQVAAVGMLLDADLAYFAGATEQRALLVHRHPAPAPSAVPPGNATIDAAIEGYALALTRNPWVERFPVLIEQVIPQRAGERWLIVDRDGHALPLAITGDAGWQLLALSGAQPLTIFGEWNSDQLLPLSARVAGELHRITP